MRTFWFQDTEKYLILSVLDLADTVAEQTYKYAFSWLGDSSAGFIGSFDFIT